MKFPKIKKIVKNYSWNSIFTHYILMLTPLFLIIFFVVAYAITSGINSTENSKNTARFNIDDYRFKNAVNPVINAIPNYHITLSSYISEITASYVHDADYEKVQKQKNLVSQMNNIKKANQWLDSIYVYNHAKDYVYSSISDVASSNYYNKFAHNEIFDNYFRHKNIIIFSEKTVNNKNYTYMSIIYPVLEKGFSANCYIAYNINLSEISKLITYPVYAVQNNEILFSANTQNKLTAEEIISMNANKYSEIKIPDSETILYMINDFNSAKLPGYIYILLSLLIIFISVATAYVIASSFYYKIDTLCDIFENPFSGIDKDQSKDKINKKYSEISYISDNIKSLILTHDKAKREISETLTKLSQAQATALQFQISPHFLFNTLNLINSIAMQELKEDTKVVKIIDLLSEILYETLDTSVLVSPLSYEIKYINNYIAIQKLKYDNFDIIWDIPYENTFLPMVRFTLQPIIENALHHGLFNTENIERTIHISSEINKDFHILKIRNTGNKIDKETEEKINGKIKNTEIIPKHSIGLWNTNKRIKLIFGDEYGCEFKALENGGAEITMILPIE